MAKSMFKTSQGPAERGSKVVPGDQDLEVETEFWTIESALADRISQR